jgi:hypothetical protein
MSKSLSDLGQELLNFKPEIPVLDLSQQRILFQLGAKVRKTTTHSKELITTCINRMVAWRISQQI